MILLNELVRLLCYGSCQDPNMNAGWVYEFRIWTSCICRKSMNLIWYGLCIKKKMSYSYTFYDLRDK